MAKEISETQLNALLKLAGKKLGTDPNTLRKTLESGNADNLLKGAASKNDSLKKALNDPAIAEKLMKSPQAMELIRKLTEG